MIEDLMGEDMTQLFHNFLFRMRACDRKLLHEQIPRRIQHFALTEGKFLIAFQHEEISQYFSDFKDRTRFYFPYTRDNAGSRFAGLSLLFSAARPCKPWRP